MKRFSVFLATLLCSTLIFAETFVNTTGSDDKTAISGFDTVAFFTEKKAIPGKQEFEYVYLGAKWFFASQENLKLFQDNPEKYVPEWGGQCAWCVSENCLSRKKINGDFNFVDGKLYLFAYGNKSKNGAKDDFMYGRWPQSSRIADGNKNWPELRRKLEEGQIVQRNSSNYKKTPYE